MFYVKMTGTTRTNPVCCFDLTIPKRMEFQQNMIIAFFRTNCKKWIFQLEKGEETDYLHYQCRISTTKKMRLETFIKLVHEPDCLKGAHVSVTSNPTYFSGDMFYVMKEDTRVDGPWDSRENSININKVPSRFRGEVVWKKWQQKVVDMIKAEPNDRDVNIIVDNQGKKGKSYMCLRLSALGEAQRVPQQKDARDIMRMVMNLPKKRCYFIDLPKGTSERDQNSTYAAIEEIKNGYCYDDRYNFKQEFFEPPHVWVFTNQMPNVKLLSIDRWKIWKIIGDDLYANDAIVNIDLTPINSN